MYRVSPIYVNYTPNRAHRTVLVFQTPLKDLSIYCFSPGICGFRKRSVETCCCSKPPQTTVHCDARKNILLHQTEHSELIKPGSNSPAACKPVVHTKSISVRCGMKHQRIKISRCDGEYQNVAVARSEVENCVCKDHIYKSMKIRCGKYSSVVIFPFHLSILCYDPFSSVCSTNSSMTASKIWSAHETREAAVTKGGSNWYTTPTPPHP